MSKLAKPDVVKASMSRQRHHQRPAAEAAFGFCQVIEDGADIFVAGMISVDTDFNVLDAGDMNAQAQRVYSDVIAVLRQLGCGPADILTETIYVTDMPSLLAVNDTRKAILTERCRPATTAVQVAALVLPGLTIEVACHARRQAMERR